MALSIMGILVAIAAPGMRQYLTGRAVDSQAQELSASMRLARSEALKRGMEVSVCSSTTTSSTPTCSSTAAWVSGWVVFADYDGNGTLDGNDFVIKVQTPTKGVQSLTTTATRVTFARSGIAVSGAASFKVVPQTDTSSKDYTRTVCVNMQGRVSMEKGDITCP